jgi:hypothetical protein
MGKWFKFMPRVGVAVSAENGLELKFDPLVQRHSTQEWCSAQPRELKVREEAMALAAQGRPAPDDPNPSSVELNIRAAHRAKANEMEQEARQDQGALLSQIKRLTMGSTEAEIATILTKLKADLAKVVTLVRVGLFTLIVARLMAEGQLAIFKKMTGLRDQSTARSFIIWLATALLTAIVEALVNGYLFRTKLGYMQGVVFAFGIGMAFAAVGATMGIGLAQIARVGQTARRVAGAVLVLAMTGVALYFLLGIGHLREAMVVTQTAAQATKHAAETLASSPLAPLRDISMLPFVVLNLVGLALVAWKSIPMFGYRDLRRLEAKLEDAVYAENQFMAKRMAEIQAAENDALDGISAQLLQTRAAVTSAEEYAANVEMIVTELVENLELVWDSQQRCERIYREEVVEFHWAHDIQSRFDTPPPRPAKLQPRANPEIADYVGKTKERFAAVEGARADHEQTIYALTELARSQLEDLKNEIEADARMRRGGVENVLRFRAGGQAAA